VRRSHILLTVAGIGAVAFTSGFAIDLFLVHQHWVRPVTVAIILNAAFSLVVSALLYTLLSYDREKRLRVLERLETIDEMNHHIRNALQVISFNSQAAGEAKLAEIDRAVNRIHWAVSEILPKVEPEFTAFEGSAKHKPAIRD